MNYRRCTSGRGYYLNSAERRRKSGIRINYITLVPDEKAHLAGTAISSLAITVNISVNEDKSGTLNIYTDSTKVKSYAVSTSGDYDATVSIAAKSNGESVRIWAESICDERTTTSEVGILFIGKTYGGGISTSTGIPTESEIKAGLSEVKSSSNGTYTYSTNDEAGRFVYAYPTALRKITKITDESGIFDYTNSVTRTTMTIDGYEYEVIYLTDPMIFDNLTLIFS